MPQGRVVRQDDESKESMKATADALCDQPMFKAMTSEDGPLPAGALPALKCASENGVKKIWQSLDDEKKAVAKVKADPKKKPKQKDESELVKPKTPVE